ncbi:MAG: CoA transferase [Myxococcales bacterium]|nr:CoA transferase [Myxococcales bacterium]
MRALDGVRVLELGQLVAGPFAGAILAEHGAEVIKVEPPEGDALRTWRAAPGETSLWWRSTGRNKRSVVVDLRRPEGRALAIQLAGKSDVLLENFRPGTLEGWGMAPQDLLREHPALVIARVSGWGQTGPRAHEPGFASVAEAEAGLRHLMGFPGGPPVRANLSLGDSVAALNAVIGVLLALRHRDATGQGQVVDVALTEAIFTVLDATLAEAAATGTSRGPSGTTITGVAPTNVYRTRDGRWIVVSGNGDHLFGRLAHALGRPELAEDPRFRTNPDRVAHAELLDELIAGWVADCDLEAVKATLTAARVPVGEVRDAQSILREPHFVARGVLTEAPSEAGPVPVPAIGPRLGATPGRTEWAGPALGAHTDEVLERLLGLDAEARARLRAAGVVA